ncbi:hypothetical protein [Streptomyces sp. NBC_01431]|uniref:hypothetical protein n=1 Tax=Streptomyces sp. NBC_01431 TaxID=2903863 RepID=UPI002E2F5927|nr:hypothetical protein [Streptomyces sp. NBC_01431]
MSDVNTSEKGTARGSRAGLIGMRSRGDVDVAVRYLASRREVTGQFAMGAAAAYRWALGRTARSPVTGTQARGLPDLRLLTAEVDAAAVQLDDPTLPPGARDFTLGAHEALAWLCGYSERRT